MTRRAVVRIYQAPDGWRWSFSRNGRVRADGGQGYSRRIDCVKGMRDSLNVWSDGDRMLLRVDRLGHREEIRLVDEGKP